eukprot:scaffold121474_cov29-Tisochrysis_lutea.AAC.3
MAQLHPAGPPGAQSSPSTPHHLHPLDHMSRRSSRSCLQSRNRWTNSLSRLGIARVGSKTHFRPLAGIRLSMRCCSQVDSLRLILHNEL